LKKIYILLLFIILFDSCVYQKRSSMEELFSMKIGYGENELGLISKEGIINNDALNISYKNGFYYISDAINNKILKTTEKGESVLFIYNPEINTNLKSTLIEKDPTTDQETMVFVKLYRNYEVYNPGLITADIDKNIYFINRLPSYKKVMDDGTIADQMILKFSSKGELLYELGKEGISTTPFGFIFNISTDEKNNLIVREDVIDGVEFYKFSPDGVLEKKVKISKTDIPLTTKERDYLVDIIDAKIGNFENEIYVTVQFVKASEDNLSTTRYETVYEKIMKYSLETQKFEKLIMKVSPEYVDIGRIALNSTESKELYGDKQKILKPMETLIGIDEEHNMYFSEKDIVHSSINKNDEILLVYNPGGTLIDNISVKYDSKIKYASDMFFSTNGRVCSYYIKDGEIHFVIIH
jgi:hypothetical protein